MSNCVRYHQNALFASTRRTQRATLALRFAAADDFNLTWAELVRRT